MYACMHKTIYARMQACMYAMYVCMHVRTCVYLFMCISNFICMYICGNKLTKPSPL